MIYEPETVKGFKDYLPPESLLRNKIKKIAEKYFRLYGFLPVETPTIEFDEIMRSDNLDEEDEAVRDRFRLRDRANRNLGLRYEFTFQLARMFRQNPNLKLPFKKYQIGSVFRDEPIKLGRTREFTQCDADVIGDSSVNADVECIAVITDILKELKINNIEIKVNNRKLLNEIINSVRIENKKQVMRELDKIDKLGEDQVKSNLRKYAEVNQILSLFKLLEKDLAFFLENSFDGAEEIKELTNKCKLFGIKIKFNPWMVRGLEYYTGNIFEICKNKTALVGGGRYDKMVGKYVGKEISAVGISFSLESITSLCKEELSTLKITEKPKAILISINQEKETINLAQKLRKNNISCITSSDKVGKSLEYADSYKIPEAIFIGEDEIKNKKFKLRNMSSGEEKLLSEKQLINKLARQARSTRKYPSKAHKVKNVL